MRFVARALVLLSAACLAGCMGASLEEKRASFRPYRAAEVDGIPLSEFVSARTAMVLRDFEVLVAANRGHRHLRLSPTGGDSQGYGTAVAISRDGYFLTAAHNLAGTTLHLVANLPGGQTRIGPARRVWVGDPDDPRFDFAILKLETTLPVAFEWAPRASIQDGTPLVVAGCVAPLSPPVFSAGRALDTIAKPEREGRLPPSSLVTHGVPVRRGDSGGPLTTLRGRLVALNVIYAPLTGRHLSVRPDPRWVRWVIARDRLRQQQASVRSGVAGIVHRR